VETIEGLAAAGLFRALAPRQFGGDERELLAVHEALIDLAAACASTAWVGALFAFHALMIQWLDERAQRDVWGDGPNALVASSIAPLGSAVRVGDHFRLDGKWPLSSGINHAKWVFVLANEAGPSEPVRSRACLVPISDCTILDDWHAAGLKGTGSHSLVMSNVVVPEYRSETMVAVNEGTARGMIGRSPLIRRTWKPILYYSFCPWPSAAHSKRSICFVSTPVPERRRIPANSTGRSRPHCCASGIRRRSRPRARCASAGRARDRGLRGLAAARIDYVIARVSYDSAYITELCSRAVARLFRGSGGHAVYERNPLQRLFRDTHTITQHVAMDFDAAREQYARTLIENLQVELG